VSVSIVHCKKYPYDVYIGRGSKWGNPFVISSTKTRQQVVDEYRVWIMTQPELLNSLHELYNKRLGCWCKQKPDDDILCHGDVLKELVEKHVQMYEDHGLSQDYFCKICGNLVDRSASCGRIYCSNGHNLV